MYVQYIRTYKHSSNVISWDSYRWGGGKKIEIRLHSKLHIPKGPILRNPHRGTLLGSSHCDDAIKTPRVPWEFGHSCAPETMEANLRCVAASVWHDNNGRIVAIDPIGSRVDNIMGPALPIRYDRGTCGQNATMAKKNIQKTKWKLSKKCAQDDLSDRSVCGVT